MNELSPTEIEDTLAINLLGARPRGKVYGLCKVLLGVHLFH